jgi:hypothetical protein
LERQLEEYIQTLESRGSEDKKTFVQLKQLGIVQPLRSLKGDEAGKRLNIEVKKLIKANKVRR